MPQYQGVWSLQQQMQALTSGQWATDPLFDYTTLLLQADNAANSAQNNTFLDSSTNAFAITRNGNTTQGTFSPFSLQPGAWANFFDGSSAQLSIANSTNLDLGSGNWTIEAWLFPTAFSGNARFFSKQVGSGNGYAFRLQPTSGYIYAEIDTVNFLTSTVSPALNTWSHVAIVRNSNTVTIYLNGVSIASASYSSTPSSQNAPTTISGYDIGGVKSEYFPGYISNLRFVKGTAVYTSSFTPSTTPLTAVTNTQLLTCQSNRFIDNSTNAFSITLNGAPSVQAFSPFAPQFQYTASVTGGSGYFDGTTDYLTGPNASGGDFSTGSFTISCWFYPTTLSSGTDYGVLAYADASGWNGWQLLARGTTKDMKFEFLSGSAGVNTITGGTIVLNAWNYVVVTRSGSTVNLYVNSTTSAATATNSTAYGVSTSKVVVGADRLSSSALFGYISNVKLVKQANTPSSIPTAPDTSTTNTSLLLNFTNAGILDGTMKNNLETVGGASVSTSVVKYGSGSIYLDGTGDYLVIPNSPNLVMGTGDFTIEFWIRPNTVNSAFQTVFRTDASATPNTNTLFINFRTGADISKLALTNNTTQFAISSALSANVWQHIAVVRINGVSRIYVDGIGGTAVACTTDFVSITPTIGYGNADPGLNGYLDDFRITKGIARYTQNFIPPSVALPRQ